MKGPFHNIYSLLDRLFNLQITVIGLRYSTANKSDGGSINYENDLEQIILFELLI